MSDIRNLSCLAVVLVGMAGRAVAVDPLSYDSDRLTVRLTPRTPQQMAAFYQARGFEPAMTAMLSEQCFITVFIKNRSADIVWLDLADWMFSNADGPVQRRDRMYWRTQWNAMQIPLAHQSTFRWTLLPERLDFRPGEQEGGNIILPRTGKPVTIRARFAVGADRGGMPIAIEFDKVQCAEDS